jgi:hypothetical protein
MLASSGLLGWWRGVRTSPNSLSGERRALNFCRSAIAVSLAVTVLPIALTRRVARIVTPKEDISAAVKLTLSASQEDLERQDTDEWWREHRAGCSFRVPPTKSGPRNAARDRIAAGLTAAPASKAQPVLGFFE